MKVGMVQLKLERRKLRLQLEKSNSNILATIYVSRYTEQVMVLGHSLSLSNPTTFLQTFTYINIFKIKKSN